MYLFQPHRFVRIQPHEEVTYLLCSYSKKDFALLNPTGKFKGLRGMGILTASEDQREELFENLSFLHVLKLSLHFHLRGYTLLCLFLLTKVPIEFVVIFPHPLLN